MAAIHLAGVRAEPCGAVRWTVLSTLLVSKYTARFNRDRIPVWGEIFRTRPDRPWGPPSLLYNGYRVFPTGEAAGAWRWPPTKSSAEVKERV